MGAVTVYVGAMERWFRAEYEPRENVYIAHGPGADSKQEAIEGDRRSRWVASRQYVPVEKIRAGEFDYDIDPDRSEGLAGAFVYESGSPGHLLFLGGRHFHVLRWQRRHLLPLPQGV